MSEVAQSGETASSTAVGAWSGTELRHWLASLCLFVLIMGASYRVYETTHSSIVLSVSYAAAPICAMFFGVRQGFVTFLGTLLAIAFILRNTGEYLPYVFSMVGASVLYLASVWSTVKLLSRGSEMDEKLGTLEVVLEGLEASRHPVIILSPARRWQYANMAATRAFGIPDDFDPGSRQDAVVVSQMPPASGASWRRLTEFGEDSEVQLEGLPEFMGEATTAVALMKTYRFTVDKSFDGCAIFSGVLLREPKSEAAGILDVVRLLGSPVSVPVSDSAQDAKDNLTERTRVTTAPRAGLQSESRQILVVKADMSVHWVSDAIRALAGANASLAEALNSVTESPGSKMLFDFTSGLTPEGFYPAVWKPSKTAARALATLGATDDAEGMNVAMGVNGAGRAVISIPGLRLNAFEPLPGGPGAGDALIPTASASYFNTDAGEYVAIEFRA